MDDVNAPVFAQAKLEYSKQLKDILVPRMFDGMFDIYEKSKEENNYNEFDDNIVKLFRKKIEMIPKWNIDIIEEEMNNIIKISKCDWLDDLITAVFISHTKILLSISSNKDNKKINLTIPIVSNFIHKCYINFGREIWKNPYLFNENIISSEYQKNIKIIEGLISDSIDITIRKLLPVKEILKEHLESNDLHKNSNKDREILNNHDLEELKLRKLRKELLNEIENKYNETDTIDEEESVDQNIKYFDDNIDENIIKKNTNGLEINNILDDTIVNNNNKEKLYDNPNIIDNDKNNDLVSVEEKLNGYKNIINNEKFKNDILNDNLNDNFSNRNELIENNKLSETNIEPELIENNKLQETNIEPELIETNKEPELIENNKEPKLIENNKEPELIENNNTLNLLTNKIENNKNIKVLEKTDVIDNDDSMTVDNFMDDINNMLGDSKEYNLF